MFKNFSFAFSDIKVKFAFLFLFTVFIYSNTFDHEYALDDQLALYDNQFVIKGFKGIPDLLTNDAFVGLFGERGAQLISGGRYRPLSFVTFAIEWQFFGQNPHISHIINVFLYALLVGIVFLFTNLLIENFFSNSFKNKPVLAAYLLAFLFSIHPIHTEVVANIKGRDEILSMLFGFSALFLFLKKYETNNWYHAILIFILFFLALLSKEIAITYIFIFWLISFYKKTSFKGIFQNKLMILALLAALLYLFLRAKYTASSVNSFTTEILNNPFVNATFSERWGTILYSFWMYLKLLLVPYPLTHDYYFNQIPLVSMMSIWFIFGILLLGLLLFYLYKTRYERGVLQFGILFFISTFSIVSNIPFTVGIIMNERFMFLPSYGFLIIFVFGLLKLISKNKNVGLLVFSIFFIFFSITTLLRNRAWKNNQTLFETDAITSNQSAKVATSLGGIYADMLDTLKYESQKEFYKIESKKWLTHSLNIYPTHSQTWLLLGNLYYKGKISNDSAILMYKKALEYRPGGFFDGYFNLGVVYFNNNQFDSALVYIEKAYQVDPKNSETKELYARLLAKTGNVEKAKNIFDFNTSDIEKVKQMEILAEEAKIAGKFNEALELAEKLLSISTENPTGNYIKGVCLARGFQKIEQAIPFLEKAIKSNPNNSVWNEDLAVAYGMTGQIAKTIPLLEKVIQSRPNDPNPYQNLAASYYQLGNMNKANFYAQKANQLKASKP
jgi:tetratricopeptide (TPR) repeat protein